MHPLQLDHPNAFYLLWPMAIKRSLQYSCKLFRHREGQKQADNKSAPLESAKKECAERDCNEQRLPNCAITDRRHEHVQSRVRPPFINEMKESLIQLLSF